MTNREKILKTNTYDLMMTICKNIAINACPIGIIGGDEVECENEQLSVNCKDCIQRWLNEEAKP